jgi:hypothetical protein
MIRGTPAFDGVALGELNVSFLGTTLVMNAKAAFVNTRTGNTHGFCTHQHWSEETITKLRELRSAMELDIGRVQLQYGGAPDPDVLDMSGLSDHVGGSQV